MTDTPPEGELKTLLRWAADHAGGIPKVRDIRRYFTFGYEPYQYVFDNWRAALVAANLDATEPTASLNGTFSESDPPESIQDAYETVVQWIDAIDELSHHTVSHHK